MMMMVVAVAMRWQALAMVAALTALVALVALVVVASDG
jgi:hypothetical protein